MKRLFCLSLALLLIPCLACAEFSESSVVYDPALAQRALQIAELAYTPAIQEAVLSLDGFVKRGDYNAVRAAGDKRHVAAYAVYDKALDGGGTAVVIAIRGTGEGEWPLNLELMPSGNYDLDYAENFWLAAEDVLAAQADYLDALDGPVFLVTGHSRGAGVANILGARLTDRFGAENVYAYTFAAPRTVRGDYPAYENIFNVINPADIVTLLPLPQWGFERYGVDRILPVDDPELFAQAEAAYRARSDASGPFSALDSGTAKALTEVMAQLAATPADIAARRALAHPGLAEEGEDGMTPGEFFLLAFSDGLSFQGRPTGALARLTQAENDFTPLLAALQSALSDGNSLSAAHMPAVYGAWMTASEN
ncbi:MAG: hypothetical protein J5998_03675 [Clostridia bacterium]|nr:hypothetical protein [Clostridia bacterium]